MNTVKTVFLLVVLSGLLLGIGQAFGGQQGLVIALIFSLGINVFSWFFSDKLVLARHRAQPIEAGDATGVYEMVQELAQRADLPMPKVYLVPDPTPNAFATGRSPQHAAVAVTQGLLATLSPREVRGVLAHELAHIKNRDVALMTTAYSSAHPIHGTDLRSTGSQHRGSLPRDVEHVCQSALPDADPSRGHHAHGPHHGWRYHVRWQPFTKISGSTASAPPFW